jgi:hypothetical protein
MTPRKQDPLVGISEIAVEFNMHRQTVNYWRAHYSDFPTPVPGKVGGSDAFWLSDVLAFRKRMIANSVGPIKDRLHS